MPALVTCTGGVLISAAVALIRRRQYGEPVQVIAALDRNGPKSSTSIEAVLPARPATRTRSKIVPPALTIWLETRLVTTGCASRDTRAETCSLLGTASRCPFGAALAVDGTKILGRLEASARLATRSCMCTAVGLSVITARPRPSVRAREGTVEPRAETESIASGSA